MGKKLWFLLIIILLAILCRGQVYRIDPSQGTDFLGNPIIGKRDIGAIEYQYIFKSKAQSVIRTRNNCTGDSIGESLTVTIPAGYWRTDKSQVLADSAALAEITANAQAYVNIVGKCLYSKPSVLYLNAACSAQVTKNNCPIGFQGCAVTYAVAYGIYTSIISQADADNQALTDLSNNKQAYANQIGVCLKIYYNVKYQFWANRNNCPVGYKSGYRVYFTVPAKMFTSLISQADANQKAITYGNSQKQLNANTKGTCVKI